MILAITLFIFNLGILLLLLVQGIVLSKIYDLMNEPIAPPKPPADGGLVDIENSEYN